MKKILTILFVLCSAISFGQGFPNQLNAYNARTQINILGAVANDSGLVFRYNFPDTAKANRGWIKNVPNIFVVIDDTLRKRSNDATRWMTVGSGSGSGGGQTLTIGSPLTGTSYDGTAPVTIGITQSDATHNGYLSSVDWNTFNGKQGAITTGNLTAIGTDGMVVTGGTNSVIGSGTSLAQHVADASHNGYLNSTDWNTFNNKQAAGSYLTAANNGLSLSSTTAVLGQNVGAGGNPALVTSIREFPFAINTYLSLYSQVEGMVKIDPAGAVNTYNPGGGGLNMYFDSTTAFPGLNYFNGTFSSSTFEGGSGMHWTPSDKHFYLYDMRDQVTVTTIEYNGGSVATFRGNGLIFLSANGASKGTAIGSTAIDSSAMFQVNGTAKGVLLVRVNTAQMNAISSPATGLHVWNTDSLALCFYNGSAWRKYSTGVVSSGITIGTTTITSGSNGRVLYDNSGIVGEMTTTGSGTVLALATSPVFTTPNIGVATATSINGNTITTGTGTLTLGAGKTTTFDHTSTFTTTDAQVYTFPTTSATLARTDAANTFTGASTATSWTLTTPVISSITNTGTLTLPTVTGTVSAFNETGTTTSGTPTPTGDSRVNWYQLTALSGNATFGVPSGTPSNHNEIYIRILDNGGARTLAWNAIYRASPDLPLPTATVISKTMYCHFAYNSASTTWDFIGYLNNF